RQARESARCAGSRCRPAAPDDSPGDRVWPRASGGCARGRRRRARADVRIRRCTPRAAVRVRPIRVDEWWRLSRPGRRAGSDRGCPGRRRVLLPAEANSEDVAWSAAVRAHARRRVLLHAIAPCAALARGPRDMTPDTVDVLVLGGGPAGLVAAIRAGDLGARTALVTPAAFGGMAALDAPTPLP